MCTAIFLGDSAVGKTSFLQRASHSRIGRIQPTIGVDFAIYQTENVTVQCWDVSGSSRFEKVVPLFAQKCQVVVYMFDVSRPSTLERIKYWQGIIENLNSEHIHFLVANRFDLGNQCGKLSQIARKYPNLELLDGRYPHKVMEEIAERTRTMSVEVETTRQRCCFNLF